MLQTIPDIWGCIPQAEQDAAWGMAAASLLGVSVVPAVTIDVYFIAAAPTYWEARLAAWRGNWQVGEEEVEIDGLPVRVYVCLSSWLGDVLACRLAGGCASGYSVCAIRKGYGSPAG